MSLKKAREAARVIAIGVFTALTSGCGRGEVDWVMGPSHFSCVAQGGVDCHPLQWEFIDVSAMVVVEDSAGNVVADAEVTVSHEAPIGALVLWTDTTGSDGAARFSSLMQGQRAWWMPVSIIVTPSTESGLSAREVSDSLRWYPSRQVPPSRIIRIQLSAH